ncbi:MAG: DNA polymerase III subunit alpha [Phycisphaerales bacterium]|nr:DNA polymerase III subunit alpha [Phycisphaerales bacterium]
MPDKPPSKSHPHPFKRRPLDVGDPAPVETGDARRVAYAELAVTTNFTFLTGASHPEEYVEQAAALGLSAIGVADCNTLAGVVRAHIAAKDLGLRLCVGARLRFMDAPWLSLIVYPTDRASYGRLCELLTLGRRRAPKGECHLLLGDVLGTDGLGDRSPTGLFSEERQPSEKTGQRPVPHVTIGGPAEKPAIGRFHTFRACGVELADGDGGAGDTASDDQIAFTDGLLAIAVAAELPEGKDDSGDVASASAAAVFAALRDTFDDDRFSLAVCRLYGSRDEADLRERRKLAEQLKIPLVAINDVYYHAPDRRPLQDAITCIRHGCTLDEAGFRLFPNGERYLKTPAEMARLFADMPEAVQRTIEIADRAAGSSTRWGTGLRPVSSPDSACHRKDRSETGPPPAGFSLDVLRYEYPHEICPDGLTPMEYLRRLTAEGAAKRYPQGVPEKVTTQIEHEMRLIEELAYAPYFLTVYDIVRYARERDILCQGRGAAANSAVCYCLGITSVDPDRINILFERFISREREEPPDIDVDFENARREEVFQYIYAKYGRERAAITATVVTYHGRSAIRDLGKVLGLSLDAVDRMSKQIHWWDEQVFGPDEEEDGENTWGTGLRPVSSPTSTNPPKRPVGDRSPKLYNHPVVAEFNPDDPTIRLLLQLCREISGFPRHLSQHVGGFVITRGPLSQLVPIENAAMDDRTVIEWDKDDIEALGMLKIDILALGMLTCIQKAFALLRRHLGRDVDLATVPAEDPGVYDMISRGDTLGVFQIESRAQMQMVPRVKPRNFYDLVIEISLVRPGPIVGNMVHPYLRRRNGEEPVTYPDEKVERVLGRTLGIPLFQEQAMALAMVAAGFTAGEAEKLRRTISAWKTRGKDSIPRYRKRFIEGMTGNGYDETFAVQCFERLKGFSEYGFPESHAASFALLVYVSSWLKCYYPAVFAAALLNSQPMGFYAPAQIIADAADHGVPLRPVDVNASDWDWTLEEGGVVLRVGMRNIRSLREADAQAIVAARQKRPGGRFESIRSLWLASGVSAAVLHTLAKADAFGSLGLSRQRALWTIQGLEDRPLPLFEAARDEPSDRPAPLPPVGDVAEVSQDYEMLGLSLKSHPVAFLRERLSKRRIVTTRRLKSEHEFAHGRFAGAAGIVLVRQRPGTAKGVLFMTIEDETERLDLILRPRIYEKYRQAALHARIVMAYGRVERDGRVVHLLVERIIDAATLFETPEVATRSRDFH